MSEPYNQTRWRNQVENGRIDRSLLAAVVPSDYDADLEGPARMHPEAAWNYQRMKEACPVSLSIVYSYRTYAKQVEKWDDYQNGGTLAAYPGTSNHGWAVAVDIASTDANVAWLRNNAQQFGFDNNDAPSERWHWTYRGGHPIEEDEMTPEEKDKLNEAYKYVHQLIDELSAAGPIAAAKKTASKLAEPGPVGPPGPEGPEGPAGPAGSNAVLEPGTKLVVE